MMEPRKMYACKGCTSEHVSPLAAAECCDPMWDAEIDRGRE